MITGRVTIDLRTLPSADDPSRDRRALELLDSCPDGADVVVDLGSRRYVSEDAAAWLHQHDHRLRITIEGANPVAVAAFVRAARAGEWSVVA